MSFDSDFQPFIDPQGFITPDGLPSGNGLRYTSEWAILSVANGVASLGAVGIALDYIVSSCEVREGVLCRRSGSAELEALDDYVAVASAAALVDPSIPRDMLKWGDSHWGSFNNPDPEKWTIKSCLYRFPAFRPHLKFAAHERPGILGRIAWAVSAYWNGFSDHPQDPWVMSWHLIHAYENSGHRSFGLDWVVERWKEKFRKRWPRGMKECLTSYFTFEHPLAKWWPEV